MGWAIDLRNKYWRDIFFRTQLNVITLQIFFAVILAILVAVYFNYIYTDILQTLLNGINEHIRNSGTFTSTDIAQSIQVLRAKNFIGFFSLAISLTLVSSYIIARMTLSPARNALKSQKRFVSDIAHELRTPIAVIKTNSEVALLDDTHSPQVRDIFKNTIEELDRVSSIINNLLTFNNLVHPEQIPFTTVNMGAVIDTSIKKLDELLKKREIKLTVKKVNPSSVWGNTIALEQIAINLIKNAANYNHVGGTVHVSIEPDYRGNVLLIVKDTGIGITQRDLAHIFEPFFRAESSRTRHSGSSGLGLTIVSELVKLHMGRISVGSKLKEGTVVTVVLPFSDKKPEESNEVIRKTVIKEVSVDFLKK